MTSGIETLSGRTVVLDLKTSFIYIGDLESADGEFVVLRQADAHDLRDTPTMTREQYIVRCREHGVAVNRERVWVVRAELTAICLLEEVVLN
ncbi:MAG: hypothetical protein K8U03_04605 [Planctomycetia bacterium]|nr:hypothetical protein [Planctomycetia bacterium]